jgi:hypothetical protein
LTDPGGFGTSGCPAANRAVVFGLAGTGVAGVNMGAETVAVFAAWTELAEAIVVGEPVAVTGNRDVVVLGTVKVEAVFVVADVDAVVAFGATNDVPLDISRAASI